MARFKRGYHKTSVDLRSMPKEQGYRHQGVRDHSGNRQSTGASLGHGARGSHWPVEGIL